MMKTKREKERKKSSNRATKSMKPKHFQLMCAQAKQADIRIETICTHDTGIRTFKHSTTKGTKRRKENYVWNRRTCGNGKMVGVGKGGLTIISIQHIHSFINAHTIA